MKKIALLFTITSLLSQNLLAADCLPNIESYLPTVKLPTTNIEASTNSNFCFDNNSNKDFDLNTMYIELKRKNVFDESNCIKDEKYDYSTSVKISDFITNSIKKSIQVYTDNPEKVNTSSLIIFTNSEDSNFVKKAIYESAKKMHDEKNSKIDLYGNIIHSEQIEKNETKELFKKNLDSNKLGTKDTLEIAGAAIGGSLIGTIVERKSGAFRNKDGSLQHDKLLHTNFGTMINLGSVAGAYLIVETAGLGDKLKLSKNQKKWAILLTGTVVGLVVGYGKERLYDYYHKDIHTFDPHLKGDMGATWLGGGAFNILSGSIAFQF